MDEMVERGIKMTHEVAYISIKCSHPEYPGIGEYGDAQSSIDNSKNEYSPCQCYQTLLEKSNSDIIIYMHDDLIIRDRFWLSKVMGHFSRREVVAVGLGGATSLGTDDLYRKPYSIWNMARGGYASNQDDAKVHGEKFDGYRKVAVLDAFFMAIRVTWLNSRGGWPTSKLTHHCLDTWLACEAARDHKEIYIEGCSCLHKGGGMSIGESYANARWLLGGNKEDDHRIPHYTLYEEYRDVLPIRV